MYTIILVGAILLAVAQYSFRELVAALKAPIKALDRGITSVAYWMTKETHDIAQALRDRDRKGE